MDAAKEVPPGLNRLRTKPLMDTLTGNPVRRRTTDGSRKSYGWEMEGR
jgi:hypothetical protein